MPASLPPPPLQRHDADLDRRFFFARLLVALALGGYVAAAALVEGSGAPLLGVVGTYVLANVGLFLVLGAGGRRATRWSFAGLDVLFVLLARYTLILDPAADPNVTLAALLALVLFAYTLYGDPRLTAALALSAMTATGLAVWLDAAAALGAAPDAALTRLHSLLATAVMGYLALAALLAVAAALALHHQRRRHAEAVEAHTEATVRAAVDRARRERVEELDRLKRSFIGVLSHELRTPITPLTSALEVLGIDLDLLEAEEDTREMLEIARGAATQLEHLVRDYTRLAELLTDEAAPEAPPNVALDALLDVLLRDRAMPAVRLDGLDGLAAAADPRLLTGALTALLRRAALVTEDGGTVTVRGRREAHHVALAVHDPDSYLEPADDGDVDDPFHAGSERVYHARSTGLEMILARHSLRRLGGRLEVESRPGAGTTVTCLLPPPHPEAPEADEHTLSLVMQVMS